MDMRFVTYFSGLLLLGVLAMSPCSAADFGGNSVAAIPLCHNEEVEVAPHPFIEGKYVRRVDVSGSAIHIGLMGESNGIDIPYQTGLTVLPPSEETGYLQPRARLIFKNNTLRDLPIPAFDVQELLNAAVTERVSCVGVEQLRFSNGVILEVVAPRSDSRILMYVQNADAEGRGPSVLWDVWPPFSNARGK